eukprot:scaffold76339_cov64-Phaeocystis_antarctica.AAC.2
MSRLLGLWTVCLYIIIRRGSTAEAEHAQRQPEHTALPRPRKVRRGREGLRQQERRHLAELVRREEGEQRAAICGARAGVRRGVRALLRGQSRGDGRHHVANRHAREDSQRKLRVYRCIRRQPADVPCCLPPTSLACRARYGRGRAALALRRGRELRARPCRAEAAGRRLFRAAAWPHARHPGRQRVRQDDARSAAAR